MTRAVAILLLAVIAFLASGAAQFLHEQSHAAAPAADRAAAHRHAPRPMPAPAHRDCDLCAQLHAPLDAPSPTLWLVDAGLWVPFVSLLAPPQAAQTTPSCRTCRGPPSPC
jgi:hypothetical protein